MLDKVKRYLRIVGAEDDTLLGSLILAAKQYLHNAGVTGPTPPADLPYATAQLGEGDDGVVTVTAPVAGIAGHAYSLTVAVGNEEAELSAALDDKAITVTLPEAGSTAADVAAAIATLGLTAEASGEGDTMLTDGVAEAYFTGGETDDENAYLQALELYDVAATLYVNMLYNGANDAILEAAMASIILQIKDYGGGEGA